MAAEANAWKVLYGRNMNTKYLTLMEEVMDQIEDLSKRLSRPIKDLDDVRQAMATLREIRDKEIFIDSCLGPVEVSPTPHTHTHTHTVIVHMYMYMYIHCTCRFTYMYTESFTCTCVEQPYGTENNLHTDTYTYYVHVHVYLTICIGTAGNVRSAGQIWYSSGERGSR